MLGELLRRRAIRCNLRCAPDGEGYVLKIVYEFEFPGKDEQKWAQQGFYLTDYELGPFLETVTKVHR